MKTGLPATVAKNLKAIRLREGISQGTLAKRAAVSTRYVQQLERLPGKNITLRTLEAIAEALRVKPSDLTGEADTPPLTKREIEAIEVATRLLQTLKTSRA